MNGAAPPARSGHAEAGSREFLCLEDDHAFRVTLQGSGSGGSELPRLLPDGNPGRGEARQESNPHKNFFEPLSAQRDIKSDFSASLQPLFGKKPGCSTQKWDFSRFASCLRRWNNFLEDGK